MTLTEARSVSVVSASEGEAVWLLGQELMEFKVTGDDTGGAFCLFEDSSPPGYGPPPHIHHREDEAFYVLEGEFRFLAEDREITVRPGSVIHVPKGALHTFQNVGTRTGRVLVMVAPAGLEKLFVQAGEPASDRTTPPPSAAGPEKLIELAPNYGLEIRLPFPSGPSAE